MCMCCIIDTVRRKDSNNRITVRYSDEGEGRGRKELHRNDVLAMIDESLCIVVFVMLLLLLMLLCCCFPLSVLCMYGEGDGDRGDDRWGPIEQSRINGGRP